MPPPPQAALQRWPSIFNPQIELSLDEFEDCVKCMNQNPQLFDLADGTLRYFSEEQEGSFYRIDGVLKHSNSPEAQHIALGILNTAINKKWHTLQRDHQTAIRNFLSEFVVNVGTNTVAINHHRYLVTKAITTLVSVAKFDWPDRWPTFVQEVLNSTNVGTDREEVMNRHHNTLMIMKILMEEVFVFGDKTMTSRWAGRKKKALESDLKSIFDLCFKVCTSQFDINIVSLALETLAVLLPCLDPQVTVADDRFGELIFNQLPGMMSRPELSIHAVKCLNEFASLCGRGLDANQKQIFEEELFGSTTTTTATSTDSSSVNNNGNNNNLPPLSPSRRAGYANAPLICETFLKTLQCCKYTLDEYDQNANNNEVDLESRMMTAIENNEQFERFFQNVALYSTTVVQYFIHPLIKNFDPETTKPALEWMSRLFLALSYSSSHGARENLKISVDFWWHLGDLLVKKKSSVARDFIQDDLEDIRLALIRNMAKPEEVTIFEDEDGELQQQKMADVESVELYLKMRQTLVFFAHVDPDGLQSNIMELMRRQLDGTDDWSWSSLNSLCWSFGAMSGALRYDEEKTFFIEFVRGMLKLCDQMSGKDNRAVIASGIMYVLSQYPQFLQAHPRFMKVVLGKLHNFFTEPFPGIKEMAVDTMLKIMSACAGRLWTAFEKPLGNNNNNIQSSSLPTPLSISLIQKAEEHCVPLSSNELYIFYESLGYLCASAPTRSDAEMGVNVLLDRSNTIIKNATAAVNQNNSLILEYMMNNNNNNSNNLGIGYDDLRALLHACRLCSRVAKTCGPCFMNEMAEVVFPCMSTMMPLFSQRIAAAVQSSQEGVDSLSHQGMRVLKQVKREFLKITEHFVAHTDDTDFLAQNIFPHVFGFLLNDYQQGHPATREPAILSLVSAVVIKSQSSLNSYVHNILQALFTPTVELIADKPEDFPEHRINFFKMIDSLCLFCFEAFLEELRSENNNDNNDSSKPDIMQGIFWAMKHTEPATSKIGCETLCTLLNKIGGHQLSWVFCERYLETFFNETFSIVVDRMHQQGFREQCAVLQRLFALMNHHHGNNNNNNNNDNNQEKMQDLYQNLAEKLSQMEGMEKFQTEKFLAKCLMVCDPVDVHSNSNVPDKFCSVIGDFLIEVKVWNSELENKFLDEVEQNELDNELAGMQRVAPTLRITDGIDIGMQT